MLCFVVWTAIETASILGEEVVGEAEGFEKEYQQPNNGNTDGNV